MINKQAKRKVDKRWKIYSLSIYAATITLLVCVLVFWRTYSSQSNMQQDVPNNIEYLKWKNANIKNYTFLLNSDCSHHDAKNMRVEVRNGLRVWPRDNTFPSPERKYKYPTIEQLFSFIERAKKTADYHRVYYHDLGFPQYASINWNEEIFDNLCGFSVEQFRILNGIGPIPSLHTRTRIKEPRFVPPELAMYENCCSLGPLRTREERDKHLKQYALPKSEVTDKF